MRNGLLASAALLAATVFPPPAHAQRWTDAGFGAAANVSVHRSAPVAAGGGFDRRHRGDRDRGRHGDRGTFGGVVYADWEWQGDSVWRSDSYNDWWHDSPNRAFPRWMQNNANCERQWWSGGGWRC